MGAVKSIQVNKEPEKNQSEISTKVPINTSNDKKIDIPLTNGENNIEQINKQENEVKSQEKEEVKIQEKEVKIQEKEVKIQEKEEIKSQDHDENKIQEPISTESFPKDDDNFDFEDNDNQVVDKKPNFTDMLKKNNQPVENPLENDETKSIPVQENNQVDPKLNKQQEENSDDFFDFPEPTKKVPNQNTTQTEDVLQNDFSDEDFPVDNQPKNNTIDNQPKNNTIDNQTKNKTPDNEDDFFETTAPTTIPISRPPVAKLEELSSEEDNPPKKIETVKQPKPEDFLDELSENEETTQPPPTEIKPTKPEDPLALFGTSDETSIYNKDGPTKSILDDNVDDDELFGDL